MVLVLFALSITVTVLKRWIQLKNNLKSGNSSGFQNSSLQPFVIVIFIVNG